MNLQNITVEPAADGFRITDNHREIPDGTCLRAQYETSTGWETIDLIFRAEAPTLLHPFRRSMFVYTGRRPSRIVILSADGNTTAAPPPPVARGIFNRTTFFPQHNFHSWPYYGNSIWDDDYLPYFLGTHFHDSRLPHHFLAQQQHYINQTNQDAMISDNTSLPTGGPADARTVAAAENAALESTGVILGGGAEVFPVAAANDAAAAGSDAAATSNDTPPTDNDSGPADNSSGGDASPSSEPNAY